MTSLVKAIQESLAKICENVYGGPAHSYASENATTYRIQDAAIAKCAAAIRAADLSDLEPKGVEGATPRTDEEARFEDGTHLMSDFVNAGFARQLERELAALTARLEAAWVAMTSAHNFLQEHWSGNPDWKKGNEHLWIARADFELERGIDAIALKERK